MPVAFTFTRQTRWNRWFVVVWYFELCISWAGEGGHSAPLVRHLSPGQQQAPPRWRHSRYCATLSLGFALLKQQLELHRVFRLRLCLKSFFDRRNDVKSKQKRRQLQKVSAERRAVEAQCRSEVEAAANLPCSHCP